MGLTGKRAIVFAENLYNELELWYPVLRLRGAGVHVDIVGTGSASTYTSKIGMPVEVNTSADKLRIGEVDALIIPGGYAPDYLRRYPTVLELVRAALSSGKVVAAICHAGWVLASAGIVRGHRATGSTGIKDDMINAGATWVDEPAFRDGQLVWGRVVADIPDFCRELVQALS